MKRLLVRMLLLCMLMAVLGVISGTALAEYRMPVADDALDAVQGLDENILNILLIGTDSHRDQLEGGLADVMMICSLNQKNGAVGVVSLQRDMWVTMGENGHENKLNAAHSLGGPNLLMQTINREFGMNIEKYVTVNFYGICDIVDALGGVTIALEKDEIGTINRTTDPSYGGVKPTSIPSGVSEATLCGAQALAYARIRSLDNDFGRTSRQRKLVYAMLQRFKACSAAEMAGAVSTCFEHVSTNLSLFDMLGLASRILKGGLEDIRMTSLPGEGDYRYDKGSSVSKLLVDKEQISKKLHEFIYQ